MSESEEDRNTKENINFLFEKFQEYTGTVRQILAESNTQLLAVLEMLPADDRAEYLRTSSDNIMGAINTFTEASKAVALAAVAKMPNP